MRQAGARETTRGVAMGRVTSGHLIGYAAGGLARFGLSFVGCVGSVMWG
ncbi:MAG: hypothetical protein U5R06_02250 [candidate division KSB1 bacterium]|nr:hypothetical protein [candidate division KSB1 bacterium]